MKKKPAKNLRVCSECAERKKMLFAAHNRALQAESALKAQIVGYLALENACEMNLAEYLREQENASFAEDAAKQELLANDFLREELALWKRIWTQDTRYAAEQARNQAQIIAALVQGNKSLRTELDRWERFRVTSPLLNKENRT